MTMVSNNAYVFSGPPDYGRRVRLDAGTLGITAAGQGTSADGREGSGVRSWEAERLVLESDAPILGGLDGEAIAFGATLDDPTPRTPNSWKSANGPYLRPGLGFLEWS